MGALVRCEYILTGNFDPTRVSAATGLEATKVWRVGEPISSKGHRVYQFDGWMRATEYETSTDIEVPLAKLLQQLRPARSIFMDLIQAQGLEAEITIAIEISNDEIPATTLAAARVAEIASLGAGLDIDIILME
jgi:hypothetical protein